ncbi:MAG: hypothetical protein R6U44_04870 [Archaeoglobaceae archaeon]
MVLILLSIVFATELAVLAFMQITSFNIVYTQFLSSMVDARMLFRTSVAQNILDASLLVILLSPLIIFPKRRIESQLQSAQKDRKVIIEQLAENLRRFETSSDKLRNPLAVLITSLEVKDELGDEEFLQIVKEQTIRIQQELDGLREEENKTYELVEEIYNKSINRLIN